MYMYVHIIYVWLCDMIIIYYIIIMQYSEVKFSFCCSTPCRSLAECPWSTHSFCLGIADSGTNPLYKTMQNSIYMYILYRKETQVGAASFRKPVNNKMHQHPSKSSTDQYDTYVPMVSDGFHRTCKRSFSVAAVTVDRWEAALSAETPRLHRVAADHPRSV